MRDRFPMLPAFRNNGSAVSPQTTTRDAENHAGFNPRFIPFIAMCTYIRAHTPFYYIVEIILILISHKKICEIMLAATIVINSSSVCTYCFNR